MAAEGSQTGCSGDNGPGVKGEQRDLLSERGFTTAETGTGFGLSIGKAIAGAPGWTTRLTDAGAGRARFERTGHDDTS